MTPQELFDMLMVYPQPSRTEILNHIEEVTRKYESARVEALLLDLADMLFQWQCRETYDRAKWEHEAREAEHRAKYEADNATYFECVRLAEMSYLGYGVPKIEWPEEPEPYEPLPFIPPMPGTITDNIHIPAMYYYAVGLLKHKTVNETDSPGDTLYLPSELDTERARHYITEAITRGFIKQTPTGFEWIRPCRRGEGKNTLIALFFGVIYCEDKIIPSHYGDKWKLGSGLFPDEPLKRLFGLNSLGAIRTNNLNPARERNAPRGWKDIIEIFD